jgi:hypothetical protein
VIRRSWRTQLKAATTQQAVLTVVSQFLDEWSSAEVAALPLDAWPGPLSSRGDVVQHALTLSRLHALTPDTSRGLGGIQEMLLFFTHASVRISQLAAIAALNAPPSAGAPAKPVTDES